MELLLLFVVVVLMLAVLLACSVASVAWAADRSNRVSPDVASSAPTSWLWSPNRLARLHRRLRAAVAPIHVPAPKGRAARRASAPPAGSTTALRQELEAQAVEIDRHLRMVSRAPRAHRPAALRQLERDVRQVELISHRLQRMDRPAGLPSSGWDRRDAPPDVLRRMNQDLDRLEAAQAELEHIERASGLTVRPEVLREVEERARRSGLRPAPALPTAAPDLVPTITDTADHHAAGRTVR